MRPPTPCPQPLPDGRAVVVMMRGDLANLSRLSGLLAATGMELGFDHGSLIREYNLQVRSISALSVRWQAGQESVCVEARG